MTTHEIALIKEYVAAKIEEYHCEVMRSPRLAQIIEERLKAEQALDSLASDKT